MIYVGRAHLTNLNPSHPIKRRLWLSPPTAAGSNQSSKPCIGVAPVNAEGGLHNQTGHAANTREADGAITAFTVHAGIVATTLG